MGHAKRKSIKRDRYAITPGQLIYSRQQTARLLGNVSVMTVIRMEAEGRLTPHYLNPKAEKPKVFYRAEEVQACVTPASVTRS